LNETGIEPGEGTPQDDEKGEFGLTHYLSCSRCGYYRRLDRRAMLSRQTTCPACPLPSRLELSAGSPRPPLRVGLRRGHMTRLPSHTNHSL
jgi:hypothetical protein